MKRSIIFSGLVVLAMVSLSYAESFVVLPEADQSVLTGTENAGAIEGTDNLKGAASVDIVPYMALTPGKWGISRQVGGTSRQGFVNAKGANGKILRHYYNDEGSGWVFDSTDVFKVTATAVIHVGTHDGTDMWVLEPVFSIPRPLKLNKPVYYTGVLKNKRTLATTRVSAFTVITGSGLTVVAPAGTFTNCIKQRMYSYRNGMSRDALELSAPGRGGMLEWRNKIKDTDDPVVETQIPNSHEMTEYGDADAPF